MWRAGDQEGEVLECYVTKRRNKTATKNFLIKTMRKYGSPKIITTDKLASYGADFREIEIADRQLCLQSDDCSLLSDSTCWQGASLILVF